jgi:hypothetical protein
VAVGFLKGGASLSHVNFSSLNRKRRQSKSHFTGGKTFCRIKTSRLYDEHKPSKH